MSAAFRPISPEKAPLALLAEVGELSTEEATEIVTFVQEALEKGRFPKETTGLSRTLYLHDSSVFFKRRCPDTPTSPLRTVSALSKFDEGAAKKVYEAVHFQPSEGAVNRVALLKQDAGPEATAEYAILGEIESPRLLKNIAEFTAIGKSGEENSYAFQQFCPSLERYLMFKSMDEALLRQVIADFAEGITALHAGGIIHRDLNIRNLNIFEGRGLVADFGAAMKISAEPVRMEGMNIEQMPPELALQWYYVTDHHYRSASPTSPERYCHGSEREWVINRLTALEVPRSESLRLSKEQKESRKATYTTAMDVYRFGEIILELLERTEVMAPDLAACADAMTMRDSDARPNMDEVFRTLASEDSRSTYK